MVSNLPRGGFDLQIPMRFHNPDSMNQNRHNPKKNSMSEEDDEPEEGNGNKSTKVLSLSSQWQRVKWTDKMVKLLITAVSYITDDSTFNKIGISRRKFAILQKKGKWKSVSKVMSERGYHVSPQQCEDKFNDMNKRYKKLNDMIGRGTCCKVVENPKLLDSISYLNRKEKDDVRKIMSSKQLFYEEMCSYHNGNRLHLPDDLALRRSLQLALGNTDGDGDDDDEYDGGSLKKMRQSQSHEEVVVDHPYLVNGSKAGLESERVGIESRTIQLEEQKIQIQVELLELERQRFRWEMFSKKRNQELEKMRMENERMKLENDRMILELKQRELDVELS